MESNFILLFVQAGLDSLGALELRNAISSAFSVDLPATSVFDHPTTQLLSQLIITQTAPASEPSGQEPSSQHVSLASHSSSAIPGRRGMRSPIITGRQQKRGPTMMQQSHAAASSEAATRQIADAAQTLVIRLVRDIIGGSPDVQQPLMEVGYNPGCTCTQ